MSRVTAITAWLGRHVTLAQHNCRHIQGFQTSLTAPTCPSVFSRVPQRTAGSCTSQKDTLTSCVNAQEGRREQCVAESGSEGQALEQT